MHYTHIWPRYMCAFKYKFMPVTRGCSLVVNCVPIGKWKAFCWQARALEYSVLKRRLEESFRSIFEWKLFYQSFLYCAHAKIRKSWPNLTASRSQHRPLSSISIQRPPCLYLLVQTGWFSQSIRMYHIKQGSLCAVWPPSLITGKDRKQCDAAKYRLEGSIFASESRKWNHVLLDGILDRSDSKEMGLMVDLFVHNYGKWKKEKSV